MDVVLFDQHVLVRNPDLWAGRWWSRHLFHGIVDGVSNVRFRIDGGRPIRQHQEFARAGRANPEKISMDAWALTTRMILVSIENTEPEKWRCSSRASRSGVVSHFSVKPDPMITRSVFVLHCGGIVGFPLHLQRSNEINLFQENTAHVIRLAIQRCAGRDAWIMRCVHSWLHSFNESFFFHSPHIRKKGFYGLSVIHKGCHETTDVNTRDLMLQRASLQVIQAFWMFDGFLNQQNLLLKIPDHMFF